MPKLQQGDIIHVCGWVMLKNLDEGEYRVDSIFTHYGSEVYQFCKPRGKRIVCAHFTSAVDPWIRTGVDLNRIERVL